MAYTLIGSIRSPFVRSCRMLMIQNGVDFEFQVLNFVENQNDAAVLAKQTPINKVPVLLDGNQKIFDSRVIFNYLTRKHDLQPLSLDEENYLSAVYSCLDTGVILFLMKRDGFDLNHPGFFMSRTRNRIPDNLEYLTPWALSLDPSRPRDWNFVSMSLYAFLYWADKREVLELQDFPKMKDFLRRFANAPGVQETSF